jgi:LuxR family maltose regulon positive regulatory protein
MWQQNRGGDAHREWPIPRAKTAVPRIPENFVLRDGLRESVTALATEFPVTLISAPAGYGKTLLLADWMDKTGAADKAWISLDAGDNDVDRFWAAVLSAIHACESVPAASRLRSLSPPGEQDAAGFLADFIDALALLPAPLCMVLDDVHEIVGDETWHCISTLIRHQPNRARVVLSTRVDPPLPLARLRVQGRLGELRADELRFTCDDAAELIRRADVPLDEDQVRLLVSRTEGWPAGVRLAARSLRDASDPEAFLAEFAGNDRAIADFLVSEVLARLPVATTDLLRLVSVCDEVTPALATTLTGQADAGSILAALERDSSLVLGVGPNRQWFRTHPLLRSYLQAELALRRPDVVAELHETAASWFASQEQSGKAFDHVTLAEENGGQTELLRRHAVPLLLTGGGHQAVRRALTQVGTEPVTRNPWLTLVSALAHVVAGESVEAEAELRQVLLPQDSGEELASLRRLVATTHALACFRPPDAAPTDWPRIVAAHEGTDLEAWTLLCLGWTCLCAGWPDARHVLETAVRLARDRGLDHVAMQGLSALGLCSCSEGSFIAMEKTCTEAITLAETHGPQTSPWVGMNHAMIGLARLLGLDPAGVLGRMRLATAALAGAPEPRLRYLIDLLAGAAFFDTGRRADGVWLMRGARQNLGEVCLPPQILVAGALLEYRSTLDIGQDPRPILGWARRSAGEVAEVSLMGAWTNFAHGDRDGTESALRETRSLPALCPTTPLEACLLETALEIRNDRRTKARSTLEIALLLAEPAALVRPFHEADPSVRHLLLEQVGGFGRSNGFAAHVGHTMSRMDNPTDRTLTSREHAVLVLLTTPQSMDEMASDLSVSVNTVKTHVRAIYAKLGVNTRRAAVLAARQLGID